MFPHDHHSISEDRQYGRTILPCGKDESNATFFERIFFNNNFLESGPNSNIPEFDESHYTLGEVNQTWCYDSQVSSCLSWPLEELSLKQDSEDMKKIIEGNLIGRQNHNPVFRNKESLDQVAFLLGFRTVEKCSHSFSINVSRRVNETAWNEDMDHYLMMRKENTLFYHKDSVEIPKQEPFLCQDDDSCVSNVVLARERCLANESYGPISMRKDLCDAKLNHTFECKETLTNPDYGYTSFDSFHMAFLTSFRLVALDAWNRLYYLTLHTSGQGYCFFYIGLVFLGSYYLINLILAVVYMAYEEEVAAVEEEIQQMEAEEAERRVRQSVMQRSSDMSATDSKSDLPDNKDSFLNPIPELKIDTCDTPQSSHKLPLIKTLSNNSNASGFSAISGQFNLRTPKISPGDSNRLNVSNSSSMRLKLHSASSGSSTREVNSILSDVDESENSSEHKTLDRWNLLRLKTPDLGKLIFMHPR